MPKRSKPIESFGTNVQYRPLSENKATVTIKINTNQPGAINPQDERPTRPSHHHAIIPPMF